MTEIIRAETRLDKASYDIDVVTFEVLRSLFDYAE